MQICGVWKEELTCQPVNVSLTWMGRFSCSASPWSGTVATSETRTRGLQMGGVLPSLITLYPLPVGLLGLTTTSIDRMRSTFRLCSSCRACRDSQLNLSEPQNSILKGSDVLEVVLYDEHHGAGRVGVRARDGVNRASRRVSMSPSIDGGFTTYHKNNRINRGSHQPEDTASLCVGLTPS